MIHSWVADRYRLQSPVDVQLLRAYTNDVYFVQSGADRYALKLYGVGWRTQEEVAYEVDLLEHLAQRGVPVARAVPTRDQQLLAQIETPEGPRVAVLFAYAPGSKPTPPFSPELNERVGRATAALHSAADDFVTSHVRDPLDSELLLQRPTDLILPLLADVDERSAFRRIVDHLGDALRTFAARGLDWGPCHGDLTLDNLHLTAEGDVILYDFDSGGPGWRALDLPGWAFFHPEAAPLAAAFYRGYDAVRPLQAVEIEAAPYCFLANCVWGMEIDLTRRIMARGADASRDYLAAEIGHLQRWSAQLFWANDR